MDPPRHKWKFFRAGGVDQVTLGGAADVANLPSLDPKLWVALAMPTRGIEFDARTLDLLDEDKDGRIRVPEVLAAIAWAKEALVDVGDLLRGGDAVPLSAIRDEKILAGARRLLANLGKADAGEITLADVTDTARIFAATKLNGDGVVPADSAEDDATRAAIDDIIATHGAVPDRSGKPGVDQDKVDAFFEEAQALVAWHRRAATAPAIRPLGDGTEAAAEALLAAQTKLDDYFTRCRLAAFDARAGALLSGTEADLTSLGGGLLSPDSPDVARLPLARIEAGRPLPLDGGVNPGWAGKVAALAERAIAPLIDGPGAAPRASLADSDWEAVKARLAPHLAWRGEKPATAVEKLGMARLEALVDTDARAKVTDLVARDKALEEENAQLVAVERLIRYQRDLFRLLKNFVNFEDFYGKRGAIFQAGTLFLDGRSCELCLEVTDPAKHAALASLSAIHLAYCECTRPGAEKRLIAAAFTEGDSDNLVVGRNGVFFDRQGRDWDATITKIVGSPNSLRQAFWAPYKKAIRFLEEQVSKRASASESAAEARLKKLATDAATADARAELAEERAKLEKAEKAPLPPEKKIDVGTVAAIGVAVGGIGAMVTGLLSTFFGLGAWMPIGLLGLMLMISGPSMLLAWLKLRQRNLGPLLDASGWAVNGRALINVPFGAALTDLATLPPGAARSFSDPYAEKSRPWRVYAVLCVLLGVGVTWYLGRLDKLLPPAARSTTVLGDYAPTAPAADPATK